MSPYSATARWVHDAVIPPTTFGVLARVKSNRPGSTRSGENATKKSSPTRSPDADSSNGTSRSLVVPG